MSSDIRRNMFPFAVSLFSNTYLRYIFPHKTIYGYKFSLYSFFQTLKPQKNHIYRITLNPSRLGSRDSASHKSEEAMCHGTQKCSVEQRVGEKQHTHTRNRRRAKRKFAMKTTRMSVSYSGGNLRSFSALRTGISY